VTVTVTVTVMVTVMVMGVVHTGAIAEAAHAAMPE